MVDGNGFEKQELYKVPKKKGVSIVVTLLERNGKSHVDIRERVDEPKEGWDGWTRRGITMPAESFLGLLSASEAKKEAIKV